MIWVSETCRAAGEIADEYEQAMVESHVEPEDSEKGLESVPQKVTKNVRRLLCQDMGEQK